LYIGLFVVFRPNKNKIKFAISLFIEFCVLTAYVASLLLVIYKSNQKYKKTLGKVITYSSNLAYLFFLKKFNKLKYI